MTLPLPTEEVEQRMVVQYCRIKGLPCFRVPNETFTKSWNQRRKNTELGVSAGVPDLFVVASPTGPLVAVEMKRRKGARSSISNPQKEWLATLIEAGIPAKVCYGADEAIDFIIEEGKK